MKNEISITSSYRGVIKIKAYINDYEYVVDVDEAEKMLLQLVEEKGFTTSKTNRQKYTRLIIKK